MQNYIDDLIESSHKTDRKKTDAITNTTNCRFQNMYLYKYIKCILCS